MKENPITPEATETAERYQITDMDGVRWYLKKLLQKDTQAAALRAELATVTANYEAMIQQIEGDKTRLELLYAAQVREVARGEAEAQKHKSVTTPYGVLSFREVPGGLRLTDRRTAADIALTLGMTTTAPDVAAYKKHAQEHFERVGEVLPGFEYKASEERFSVSQSKAKKGEGGEEAQEAP